EFPINILVGAQQTIKVNQHGAQTQIQAALITTTASSAPLGQAFGLPPLPEHNPCDNSIARPELWIVHNNTMIRLLWIVPSTSMGSIREYEIYTYQQGVTTTSSDWKKVWIIIIMINYNEFVVSVVVIK
ncbi:unnamed protein product, partial [Rotaria sp. Silwood2]